MNKTLKKKKKKKKMMMMMMMMMMNIIIIIIIIIIIVIIIIIIIILIIAFPGKDEQPREQRYPPYQVSVVYFVNLSWCKGILLIFSRQPENSSLLFDSSISNCREFFSVRGVDGERVPTAHQSSSEVD